MKIETLSGEVIDLSNLKNNSIILVRGVTDHTLRERLVIDIQKVVPVNSVILVFGKQECSGLEIVPEEKMNELGWYRHPWKDLIAKFMYRIKKLLAFTTEALRHGGE